MIRVFCALALALVATFASCRNDAPGVEALTERQQQLSQQVNELSRSVSALRKAYLKDLDAKEADFNAFASGVKQLNKTADAMRACMEEFVEYKHRYREHVRVKAPGTELGDLAVGFQTLRNARVREINNTHIVFSHSNGTSRVLLAEAPVALQNRFAYDPLLDAVMEQATGTGTDWLLSAMEAAQKYASGNPAVVASKKVNSNAAAGVAPVNSSYASSYPPSDQPTWRRFSSFTGSFWAPLQNRKRVAGTVNSYSSSYFSGY